VCVCLGWFGVGFFFGVWGFVVRVGCFWCGGGFFRGSTAPYPPPPAAPPAGEWAPGASPSPAPPQIRTTPQGTPTGPMVGLVPGNRVGETESLRKVMRELRNHYIFEKHREPRRLR